MSEAYQLQNNIIIPKKHYNMDLSIVTTYTGMSTETKNNDTGYDELKSHNNLPTLNFSVGNQLSVSILSSARSNFNKLEKNP